MTRIAGSSVVIARKATPIPIAATGPRLLVEFISANSRQSMPRMTVPAEAKIAGQERPRAIAIASCRSR